MQWPFRNLRTRHRVTLALILISAVAVAAYFLFSKIAEVQAWRDPMAMRPQKRLWLKGRESGLEDYDFEEVELLLEEHDSVCCPRWERRVIRSVLAVVIEYPAFLNPPVRNDRLTEPGDREMGITAHAAELREFIASSDRSKWADENWAAIEQWLTTNIGSLRVNDEGNRFVLSE